MAIFHARKPDAQHRLRLLLRDAAITTKIGEAAMCIGGITLGYVWMYYIDKTGPTETLGRYGICVYYAVIGGANGVMLGHLFHTADNIIDRGKALLRR